MVNGLYLFGLFVIKCLFVGRGYGICTFPDDIRGTWYSSEKGYLNFTESVMEAYPMQPGVGITSLSFQCQSINGTVYVLRSTTTFSLFGPTQFSAYLCLDLHPVSHYKYWYLILNNFLSPPTERYRGAVNTTTLDFASTCDRVAPYETSSRVTLVKDGAFEDGLTLQTCPTPLLHTFSNSTLTSSADAATSATCSDTTINVCAVDTEMLFNYSSSCSSDLMLSSPGEYICLLDFTDSTTGVTYLHVWNNDTSLTSTDKKIHCFAYEYKASSSEVQGTLYPGQCQLAQTAETVTSPGIVTIFGSITATCYDVVEGQAQTPYIIALIFGCIVFILLIVLICIIIKCRRRWCKRCYNRSKTGHSESDATLGSDLNNDGQSGSGSGVMSPSVFIARKAKKLGPIVTPIFVQPAKIDLLYEVIPRPMSSKKKFMPKSIYTSQVSLRVT